MMILVMAGLDPAIHVLPAEVLKDVDTRVKPGHDETLIGKAEFY
jgi:hypothetical protein